MEHDESPQMTRSQPGIEQRFSREAAGWVLSQFDNLGTHTPKHMKIYENPWKSMEIYENQ